MDSEDETYYGSGEDYDLNDCEDQDELIEEEEEEEEEGSGELQTRKNYTVLKGKDVLLRQEADIEEVSTILSVPKDSACLLLLNYNWDVNRVSEAWFSDQEKVRKTVGLLSTDGNCAMERPTTKKRIMCDICFDYCCFDDVCSVGCGHSFCKECWIGYVSTSIKDGPGCLTLRCPYPKCGVAVGTNMIVALAGSEQGKEKYREYLRRSYVEASKKIKWCPAPDCECAVEFVLGSASFDVTCGCSNIFCWNCTHEAHRPVDCETVYKWMLKNESEAENVNWILAHTKPCPKCKRLIEKNQGCNHMTCTPPCNYQFCWICLEDWNVHDDPDRACNGYNRADVEGGGNAEEMRRKKAKQSLERYIHYYERWAAHNSSMGKAIADLHKMDTVNSQNLRDKYAHLPESQLEFVVQAWQLIVDCRRVLKWSYAYGYYLPEGDKTKRRFFEHLQGNAELSLERLHHCAEQELQAYLGQEAPQEDKFLDFRQKLVGLNKVTKTYFGNLVTALENGLTDVESARGKKDMKRRNLPEGNGMTEEETENPAPWECEECSYLNIGPKTVCIMCNKDSPGAWLCDKCIYLNPKSATACQVCQMDPD